MKKDISILQVKNVTVAITRSLNELNENVWNVYLINNNSFDLENTIVATTGYGKKEGKKVRTSTLRHFIDQVPANSFKLIEPINPELFVLNNEFWVTYYHNGEMYDKKFTFIPGAFDDSNLTVIEILDQKGILHS